MRSRWHGTWQAGAVDNCMIGLVATAYLFWTQLLWAATHRSS